MKGSPPGSGNKDCRCKRHVMKKLATWTAAERQQGGMKDSHRTKKSRASLIVMYGSLARLKASLVVRSICFDPTRKHQISLDATPFYRCLSRCVRHVFLCGFNRLSGKFYSFADNRLKMICCDSPLSSI